MKHLYFVAGESSGDTRGAELIRALRAAAPSLRCEGLGGPQMADAGMELHYDLAGRGIMGFTEVVKHFPFIRRLFHETVDRLRATLPDCLVLIDYPGFNIRLAKAAHALGIRVIYYISPQVWAWKKGRVQTLAECVDKMIVIFPFEEPLYEAAGLDCSYVGHPLVDKVDAYTPAQRLEGNPVIGLLPGSREQEIARLFGPMLAVAAGIREAHQEARFYVPAASAARAAQVRDLAGDFPLEILDGGMYDVLASARFALVASGTATLETALFEVPFVIVYKVNPLTYWLARRLVDIPYIGMVNILAGRELVPEFIQNDAAPDRIIPRALELIDETPARQTMRAGFVEVRERLGDGGAADRAAQAILNFLEESPHG